MPLSVVHYVSNVFAPRGCECAVPVSSSSHPSAPRGASAVTDMALVNTHQLGGCLFVACHASVQPSRALWVELGKPHDQCLSHFNVHTDHQGILFKQIFWFSRSAFLRSPQMLLLLLVQETHFENWFRCGPKRSKCPCGSHFWMEQGVSSLLTCLSGFHVAVLFPVTSLPLLF